MSLDLNWDDPLPHALTRRRTYGALPGARTKAALILLHGRGDNARDFAEVFVRAFRQRAPELFPSEDAVDDADESSGSGGGISVVALEARDNAWWPASHTSTDDAAYDYNHPYVWSSLARLHSELTALVELGISPERIIVAGFSQGAIFANTYLQAYLSHAPDTQPLLLPRHIFALAGTRHARTFAFPQGRKYISDDAEAADREQQRQLARPAAQPAHAQCTVSMICGTHDRYFRVEELEAARDTLQQLHKSSAWADRVELDVHLQLLEGVAHFVTPPMINACVDAALKLV